MDELRFENDDFRLEMFTNRQHKFTDRLLQGDNRKRY